MPAEIDFDNVIEFIKEMDCYNYPLEAIYYTKLISRFYVRSGIFNLSKNKFPYKKPIKTKETF